MCIWQRRLPFLLSKSPVLFQQKPKTKAEGTPNSLCPQVLDNLPHDRVALRGGAWHQTHVDAESGTQELAPAKDPLIAEVLAAVGPPLAERMRPPLLRRLLDSLVGAGASRLTFVGMLGWVWVHIGWGGSVATLCSIPEFSSLCMNTSTAHCAPPNACLCTLQLQPLDVRASAQWCTRLRRSHSADPDGGAVFIPTGAWAFLKALHAARPRHCLLAADFDFLPEVRRSPCLLLAPLTPSSGAVNPVTPRSCQENIIADCNSICTVGFLPGNVLNVRIATFNPGIGSLKY